MFERFRDKRDWVFRMPTPRADAAAIRVSLLREVGTNTYDSEANQVLRKACWIAAFQLLIFASIATMATVAKIAERGFDRHLLPELKIRPAR